MYEMSLKTIGQKILKMISKLTHHLTAENPGLTEFLSLWFMYYIVYALLYVLSLLPLRILYVFSDIIYFFIYHVFGYRKKYYSGYYTLLCVPVYLIALLIAHFI